MNAFRFLSTSRLARLLLVAFVPHAHGQIATPPPGALIGTAGGGITIAASAPAAASLQWEKSSDGGNSYTAITGNASATTSSPTLSNLQASDAARYRLVTPEATSGDTVLSVITAAQKNSVPQVKLAAGRIDAGGLCPHAVEDPENQTRM